MANIKNAEFQIIEQALSLIDYNNLNPIQQNIVTQADVAMMNVLKRQKANNEKTKIAIRNKRKINPNYAR